MVKAYYELIKPRIIYGNMLTAAAGFFAAGEGPLDWGVLFLMLAGLACVVGSACAVNNFFDRGIDAHMERTKNRVLVRGAIQGSSALALASVLLVAGSALLWLYTTPLALFAALAGFVVYTALYTPLKHMSGHALWVGAIAGAMPPVVGYTAATNTIDGIALTLFIFLAVWQVPHFLAIALYRWSEYKAAGVPLLIRQEPGERAKRQGRVVFYVSLLVLLVACVGLILQRWIR